MPAFKKRQPSRTTSRTKASRAPSRTGSVSRKSTIQPEIPQASGKEIMVKVRTDLFNVPNCWVPNDFFRTPKIVEYLSPGEITKKR
jgi:hypothetical protein